MSLVEIGRLFRKTHATIINGIKKHHSYTRYKGELYLAVCKAKEYTINIDTKQKVFRYEKKKISNK